MICKKSTTKQTSFPGFSPTCPYRARERERETERDRSWLGLVTWLQDKINSEGRFLCLSIFWLAHFHCLRNDRKSNIELLTLLDKLDKQVNNQRRNQKLALSQFHLWNQSLKFYTSMLISWREIPVCWRRVESFKVFGLVISPNKYMQNLHHWWS